MLRIHDAILNGLAFCLLAGGVAAINKDVRRHIVNMIAGDSVRELVVITAPADRAMRAAFDTMRDFQTDNTAMFAFAVAAVVLFAFLFKA